MWLKLCLRLESVKGHRWHINITVRVYLPRETRWVNLQLCPQPSTCTWLRFTHRLLDMSLITLPSIISLKRGFACFLSVFFWPYCDASHLPSYLLCMQFSETFLKSNIHLKLIRRTDNVGVAELMTYAISTVLQVVLWELHFSIPKGLRSEEHTSELQSR